MIGDGHQDVLAGRAAGLRTIWVAWGFGQLEAIDAAGPDARVTTMAELRTALLASG
jgi:phosphoglycolate phosphatase-like HAD superfamily hydrolase